MFYIFLGENNLTELAGYHNGEVVVKVFDWVSWLGNVFKKLDNILSYQIFKFSSTEPGVVRCYKTIDSEPVVKNLLKLENPHVHFTTKPDEISPDGLSKQRQMYLYNQIREFCKVGTEDYVAPNPNKISHRKCLKQRKSVCIF